VPKGNQRISEHASVGGKARANRRLTLAKVEAEFGTLVTIEDAMRRLDRLGVWAAAKMLPGSVAGAAVRSVEVWLRANESKLTREVVNDIKGEVIRLKAELKGRRLGVAS
jgi:hypothetical protein